MYMYHEKLDFSSFHFWWNLTKDSCTLMITIHYCSVLTHSVLSVASSDFLIWHELSNRPYDLYCSFCLESLYSVMASNPLSPFGDMLKKLSNFSLMLSRTILRHFLYVTWEMIVRINIITVQWLCFIYTSSLPPPGLFNTSFRFIIILCHSLLAFNWWGTTLAGDL